jgi:replicative DNA helicase
MDGIFTELYNSGCVFSPSKISIIGGRPGMGKTTLAINLFLELVKIGKKCTFITFEETKDDLIDKLLSIESFVEYKKIKSNKMSGLEYQRFIESTQELQSLIDKKNLNIKDLKSIKYENQNSICTILEEIKEQDIIFIDNLQLLKEVKCPFPNRYEELDYILNELNKISKENEIHIVFLAQLSRKIEERQGYRPTPLDIRHCNADEIADYILFPFRREYYDPMDKPGMIDIILSKNRCGPVGCFRYEFKKEFLTIVQYEKHILTL